MAKRLCTVPVRVNAWDLARIKAVILRQYTRGGQAVQVDEWAANALLAELARQEDALVEHPFPV